MAIFKNYRNFIKGNWGNFVPLMIFVVFMSLYITAQATMSQCGGDSIFPFCSSVKVQDYIVSTPLATLNPDGTIKEPIKTPDGKVIYFQKIMGDRYGRQFVWVFLISINVFFAILAMAVFILLSNRFVKDKKIILLSVLLCMTFGFISASLDGPVMEKVIRATIQAAEAEVSPGRIEKMDVATVVKVVNFAADTIAIAIIMTLCAVLYRKPDEADSPKSLLDRVESLRIVLYVATLLLIVGVLRMSAVLNWSLAFLSPELSEAAGSFFGTFTFVIGSAYTILLASTYLPAYFILKKRADDFLGTYPAAGENDSERNKLREGLEKEFSTFSFVESLPRIIAIIAPFLTGSAAEQFLALIKN